MQSPKPGDDQVIPHHRLTQLREARAVIQHEANALLSLLYDIDTSFCDAVDLIHESTGTVIVTGVGKAGLIGQKIVATMASTGTRAYFLHPTEALHGDLGCVGPQDIVLALSNSGSTEEVLRLLPPLKRLQVPVIAITRDRENPLAKAANIVLPIGRHKEAGELQLAPSVSTTAMVAMGDALSLVLSRHRGFTETDFAGFHPAGSLGRKLQPVHEVMRQGAEFRVACATSTVREVMIELSRPGRRTGAVVLIKPSGAIAGIFTDSDLARLFEQRREHLVDGPIADVMTVNPTTIHPDALLPEAMQLMSDRKISELPVVDQDRRPLGLIDITDVIDFASMVENPEANQNRSTFPVSKSA
ncbi:MAG: KpsF/GutQ family sugar-phosphate isomerase [Fuerstiella sp.]